MHVCIQCELVTFIFLIHFFPLFLLDTPENIRKPSNHINTSQFALQVSGKKWVNLFPEFHLQSVCLMVILDTSLLTIYVASYVKYTVICKTSKTYQEITCGGVSSFCSLTKTTPNNLKYSADFFAILSLRYLVKLSIPVSDICFKKASISEKIQYHCREQDNDLHFCQISSMFSTTTLELKIPGNYSSYFN